MLLKCELTNITVLLQRLHCVHNFTLIVVPFIHVHYIIIRPRFFWGKCDLHVYIMDRTVTSNIEIMSWEMWIWLLIRDTMICRMNKHIWLNEHWTIVSPIAHLYINGYFPDLVQVLQQQVVVLIFTLLVKWCSLESLLHME